MARAPPELAERRPSSNLARLSIRPIPLKERRNRGRAAGNDLPIQSPHSLNLVLHNTGAQNKPLSPEERQLALDTASLLETITSAKQWPNFPHNHCIDDADLTTDDAGEDLPDQPLHSTESHAADSDSSRKLDSSHDCAKDTSCAKIVVPAIRDVRRQADLLSLDAKFLHLKNRYYTDKSNDHNILADLEKLCQSYYAMAEYKLFASTQLWLAVVKDRANYTDIVVEYLAETLTGIPGKHFSDPDKFQLEKLIVKHGFQVWHCMLDVARGPENRDLAQGQALSTIMEEGLVFVQGVLAYIRGLYADRNSWPDIRLEHDILFHDLLSQIHTEVDYENCLESPQQNTRDSVVSEDLLPRSAVSVVLQRVRDSPSRRQLLTGNRRINSKTPLQYGSAPAPAQSVRTREDRLESTNPSRNGISEMPANVSLEPKHGDRDQDQHRPRRVSEVAIHQKLLATDTPGGAELDKLLHSRRVSEERRKSSVSPLYIPSRNIHLPASPALTTGKSINASPQELAATPPLSPRRDSTVHAHSPLSQSSAAWDAESDDRSSGSSSDSRSGAISPHTLPAPRHSRKSTLDYAQSRTHRAGTSHHKSTRPHPQETLLDELESAAEQYGAYEHGNGDQLDAPSEAEQADDELEEDSNPNSNTHSPATSTSTSSQRLVIDNRLSALAALEAGSNDDDKTNKKKSRVETRRTTRGRSEREEGEDGLYDGIGDEYPSPVQDV